MPPIVAAKEFKEKDREMEERARGGRERNEIANRRPIKRSQSPPSTGFGAGRRSQSQHLKIEMPFLQSS